MAEQLQITFRHMDASDALRELANEKLTKLRTHHPDAIDCHVVVDAGSVTRHRKGSECTTHVELTVGTQHTRIAAEAVHEDAYTGMRHAFENLKRQIESHAARRAG